MVVAASDPRLHVLLKERLETGKAYGELAYIRRDGTKLEGEVTSALYRNKDGDLRASVIIRDVSKYKHVCRLAIVLRDANDAITVQDFAGKILAWNPAAEKMYGFSEAEALAMNVRKIVPADKRAEYDAFVEKLARGDIVATFETQRVTKEGQTPDVRLTVTALVDAQGKPYAIATTERNLTRQAFLGKGVGD